jgi:hypothetical protein
MLEKIKEKIMKNLIEKEIKKIQGNIDLLINIMGMEDDEFCAYGFEYLTEDKRKFYFMDNWADILAVAHIDTVQKEPTFSYNKKNDVIYSNFLDNRLGAYIILEHLLRELNYDVLLTVDGGKTMSTARSFNLKNNYKWIFSFDRKGTDVVMYNYETPALKKELAKYGFETGKGSYSDICELEHLGCKGFNFGAGYYDAQSINGYANLKETAENIVKFRNFYNANCKRKFRHKPKRELNPGSATTDTLIIELTD